MPTPKKISSTFLTYVTPAGYTCTCGFTAYSRRHGLAQQAAEAHAAANHTKSLIIPMSEKKVS